MMKIALPLFALACFACEESTECSSTYGKTESALRRGGEPGGWDANGRSMFGLVAGTPGISGVTVESASLQGGALEVFDVNEQGLIAKSERGEILTGDELNGAELFVKSPLGVEHHVEIVRVVPTIQLPELARYELLIDGSPACTRGQFGLFVEGRWDEDGRKTSGTGLSFSCENGAVFKCVSWGFAPWSAGEDVHQSCTRMVRADYCGDGRSYTENGTLIWVSEAKELPVVEEKGYTREAGWGPNGAVCVDHPRFEAVTASGENVLPSCIAELPACAENDRGALLYNGSQTSALTVCSGG